METGINENRDLDLFYAMLQERARAIKAGISRRGNIDFELFRSLPRDISMSILSRLPIVSIMQCKVVCKAWRDLINSPEFGNYQSDRHCCLIVFPETSPYRRSKYDATYIIYQRLFKIKEWNNKPIPILHMDLFESVPLGRNSVNGLILLLHREWTEQQQQRVLLWVCNPITREYVTIPNPPDGLPCLPKDRCPGTPPHEYVGYNFGFGLSRTSLQYKVVWISESECQVYTLGTTGGWRSIATSGPGLLRYNNWNTECAFLGGNLYWLELDTEISCFDLETEVFTYFCAPPTRGDLHVDCYRSLCVLDECLCLCDVYGDEIEIWLMRGREWSKKLAINEQGGVHVSGCGEVGYGYLFPIKDDGNGGMLLGARCNNSILCYSSGNGTRGRIRRLYPRMLHSFGHAYPRTAVYTPSFLPLRTVLVDEDVHSWDLDSI